MGLRLVINVQVFECQYLKPSPSHKLGLVVLKPSFERARSGYQSRAIGVKLMRIKNIPWIWSWTYQDVKSIGNEVKYHLREESIRPNQGCLASHCI
jgi:hypothetical protein